MGRQVALAPLDPDLYLAWLWKHSKPPKAPRPPTVDSIWYDMVRIEPSLTYEDLRRNYVHIAAWVRRNQRLGLHPLLGTPRRRP